MTGHARRARGLAPSIISADAAAFGDALLAVAASAARWHVDIMDGHYVPNLTIGPSHVEAIGRISDLPQDVHLMVANPARTWEWYARAGATRIAFHPDAAPDPAALLQQISGAGVGAGLAVNPGVAAAAVEPYLDVVEHLVVMSVQPGFSGQEFIPGTLAKIAQLRKRLCERGLDVHLIVDGGVNERLAPACVDAGADVLVSASAIFHAPDPAAVAARLASMTRRDEP